MSVMYATTAELSLYLHTTVDTPSATLALQVASALFSLKADTWFTPTTTTFQCAGNGSAALLLPFRPVTAVSAVRVNGVAVTDYTRIKSTLYRTAGWGAVVFPPQLVEVDLTYGLVTAPDDVKGAVLETAGAAYLSPDITVASESIDDYVLRSANGTGGVSLSPAAAALASLYRGSRMA